MDIVEYGAIKDWQRGKPERLVKWFARQQGKVLSPQLHQFVLEVLQGTKRKKGAPTKTLQTWNIKQDYLVACSLAEELRKSRESPKRREIIMGQLRALFDLSDQTFPPLSKTAIQEALAIRYSKTSTRIRQILSTKQKPAHLSTKN